MNSPFSLGGLTLDNRLIQGPLAGYSCAPFRLLFQAFRAPAYCVSEMCSAQDVLNKHEPNSRYLYRAPKEGLLAYQIAGTDPELMAQAAQRLEGLGAALIDINCGCPKAKIRKKGAGSALLEKPELLTKIVSTIRQSITIPLTVKIRIQGNQQDIALAKAIEQAGASALIVHGRRWEDDYDIACDFAQIARIKQNITIPVIANGDIDSPLRLQKAFQASQADAFMIGRKGCGHPWLYEELLTGKPLQISMDDKIRLFTQHLQDLAALENETKAILQSKSLIRYYFRQLGQEQLQTFYELDSLEAIKNWIRGQPRD